MKTLNLLFALLMLFVYTFSQQSNFTFETTDLEEDFKLIKMVMF